jgi:hypothetical protein
LAAGIHLNLDDAWCPDEFGLACRDARAWGPRVRYFLRSRDLPAFDNEVVAGLPPFVLYGSGDFHHLTALRVARVAGPVTVVVFDNHPDWDVRPPRYSCGGWVNRVLEMGHVERVVVWGCGNFELEYPSVLFANRRDRRRGRLVVRPWAERVTARTRDRFACVTREDWRQAFDEFAAGIAGRRVYLTADLDCLERSEAVTNWENGLFSAGDVARAVRRLHGGCHVVGGDVCGAFSPVRVSRWPQRLASWWDQPPQPDLSVEEARCANRVAAGAIWDALRGCFKP